MQDTPSIRITYGACLIVDQTLTPYMSANSTGTFYGPYGYYKHCFYSQVPIPNYLMSLAIGDLGYLSVGDNTGVIADNAILQTAFVDFSISNLQGMLDTAEAYIQLPYIWSQFNVVIMPPFFPMGNANTPMMAFMSPTVMTPAHSQVQTYAVVNAICHSWTGSIVSNSNWQDTWINEGFSTYFERAVLGQYYGYDFAMTEALNGNNSLV